MDGDGDGHSLLVWGVAGNDAAAKIVAAGVVDGCQKRGGEKCMMTCLVGRGWGGDIGGVADR